MFGRIYRDLANAVHIDRAFTAAAESRTREALDILDRRVKGGESLYYVRLLRGQLHEKSGRFDDALREFVAGHRLIAAAAQLSGPEKAYFEAYAAVAARRCAGLMGDTEAPLAVRLDAVDPRKVSGRIKRYFPLTEHPKWGPAADTP